MFSYLSVTNNTTDKVTIQTVEMTFKIALNIMIYANYCYN